MPTRSSTPVAILTLPFIESPHVPFPGDSSHRRITVELRQPSLSQPETFSGYFLQ